MKLQERAQRGSGEREGGMGLRCCEMLQWNLSFFIFAIRIVFLTIEQSFYSCSHIVYCHMGRTDLENVMQSREEV
jgi:hypothetical protein